jgi:hypothetical protein
MPGHIRAALLTAAIVAPVLATGLSAGGGTASAATPPTISVTLWGATDWLLAWDGSPAVNCVGTNGVVNAVLPGKGTGLLSYSPGIYKVSVKCDGQQSATVTLYSPRDPLNDARTNFSNSNQGMFGS